VKTLIAEDNPVFRRLLQNMLVKWGYEVVVATDGIEAWQHLQMEDPPRLAILDWMMPGLDGVEVCRRVRSHRQEPYIYLLLLTAKNQHQDLLAGLEAGADDYLTKPFDNQELRVRLRAGQRILDLQAGLVCAREALREQATRDALTGLWNRAAIFDILQRELARASREAALLAIVMMDLDWFKQVNDRHGHLTGDAVLREAARRMRTSIRPYDAAGRYGGEEFLITLPGCNGDSGAAQAERLRRAIGGEPFPTPAGILDVTCSLGVAWTEPAENLDADLLVHNADAALYLAKNRGRNRVECAAASPVNALG
jgi:two-component system cell cycle response regulator